MLMPGRDGHIGKGRNVAGSTVVMNGDTIPATLTVTQRTNNTPGTYMATEVISFEEEFTSGTGDELTTLFVDQTSVDPGNESGISYGIAAKRYRYGFNGKENDNEVKGEGNEQDYGMRVYDPRIGKFLSVDPLSTQYPELTPYQYASNTPIQSIDLDGKEAEWFMLEWLERKIYGSTHLKNVREGFTEKGVGVVKGLANIPKGFFSWLDNIPLTTIADPHVKNDYYGKQQMEAVIKQSTTIVEDYVNLVDRASTGEDKAIGELAFEAAMLVVPGGEEAKMGEIAAQAAKLEAPIARVSRRLMGLKDRNLVKYDVKYFGSRIKGTNRLNSDLDVLILTEETDLFKQGSRLDRIISEIRKDFLGETGIELDINVMDTKTYNVAKQGQFKLNVEQHAQKVVRPNKTSK